MEPLMGPVDDDVGAADRGIVNSVLDDFTVYGCAARRVGCQNEESRVAALSTLPVQSGTVGKGAPPGWLGAQAVSEKVKNSETIFRSDDPASWFSPCH